MSRPSFLNAELTSSENKKPLDLQKNLQSNFLKELIKFNDINNRRIAEFNNKSTNKINEQPALKEPFQLLDLRIAGNNSFNSVTSSDGQGGGGEDHGNGNGNVEKRPPKPIRLDKQYFINYRNNRNNILAKKTPNDQKSQDGSNVEKDDQEKLFFNTTISDEINKSKYSLQQISSEIMNNDYDSLNFKLIEVEDYLKFLQIYRNKLNALKAYYNFNNNAIQRQKISSNDSNGNVEITFNFKSKMNINDLNLNNNANNEDNLLSKGNQQADFDNNDNSLEKNLNKILDQLEEYIQLIESKNQQLVFQKKKLANFSKLIGVNKILSVINRKRKYKRFLKKVIILIAVIALYRTFCYFTK
ncbi:uncharacterized protein ASCRUDRAFT_103597 [Ascoidea rubescens DSM 1968]|uniref:Uncharacterized protein n=1 Tax=Ascoidea rubescens DSM 1968 TaxID=1344418 RepID=A0A1D2VRI5_9ASCO|nr:hypothetical protein ASCRUDRAFT_103597 [Ascoidea rubescens DSM 1968]ODV64221.1 hypothetical protein ASCRUDRAFT_103597 [Ascoidea rubescens DSM 1968]